MGPTETVTAASPFACALRCERDGRKAATSTRSASQAAHEGHSWLYSIKPARRSPAASRWSSSAGVSWRVGRRRGRRARRPGKYEQASSSSWTTSSGGVTGNRRGGIASPVKAGLQLGGQQVGHQLVLGRVGVVLAGGLVGGLRLDLVEELDVGVSGRLACGDDGGDVAADGVEITAAQQRSDDADDQRVRVLHAHRL